MAIVDIVIIAILAFGVIVGFAKGFVNSIFGFIGTILALVAAYFLARPFISMLLGFGWNVDSMVTGWFNSLLGKMSLGGESWAALKYDQESLLTALDQARAGLVVPFFNGMFESAAAAIPENLEGGVSVAILLAPYVASPVLVLMAMIVLFILFKIVLCIVEHLLNKVLHFASLKTIDRLLGLVLGAVEAALVVLVLISIASVVIPNPENVIMKYLLDSKIVLWVNTWNPIPGWLASVLPF